MQFETKDLNSYSSTFPPLCSPQRARLYNVPSVHCAKLHIHSPVKPINQNCEAWSPTASERSVPLISIALLAPSWAVLVERELLTLSCDTGILTCGQNQVIPLYQQLAVPLEQDYGDSW